MIRLVLASLILLGLSLVKAQAQMPPDSKFKSTDEAVQALSQAMAKKSFVKITTRKKEMDQKGAIVFGKTQTWWGTVTNLSDKEFELSDNCFMCDGYILKYSEIVSIARRPKTLRVLRNTGEKALLIGMVPAIPILLITEKVRK